jgi:hypothetical protein
MPEPFSATAPVKSLPGTAAKPGVTFTGDEDTGLYRSGTNELAVTVGGAEAAKFTATQTSLKGDINLDDGGSFQTTLQLVTPTAARTITFPDATGTVGLVAGSTGNLVVNQSGAYAGVANSSVDNATGNITLGSRFISSLNGAASAPPGTFTGTWFTGGTATTTKPQVLIEPTGTTSTAWSTSGTGLGVNAASGFGGRLLDLQTNGTSRAVVTGAGLVGIGTSDPGSFSLYAKSTGAYAAAFETEKDQSNNTAARRLIVSQQNFRTSIETQQLGGTGWESSSLLINPSGGNVGIGTTSPSSLLHLADAGNITVGTTTGTKIGTATTQKLGFYNATPVVQPAAVADATDAATVITQLNDLLAKLRTLGIIAT